MDYRNGIGVDSNRYVNARGWKAKTMKKILEALSILLASVLVLSTVSAPYAAWADTAKPGFNLFTVEQDIEIGRQSAAEAERQLPLLNDRAVDRYLNQIVRKLASGAQGASYPYQIKAVNDSQINAFSLPGGFMYVNRGLFEAARSEAELAGVLAHEMSHVALRHGTHQASRAYLGQAGISILGGLLGKDGGNTTQIVNAIGGVGLNTAFLKFSRDDEYQADELGAEIMALAGYDPRAMANFFELLRREQDRDPGRLERFFSDHPSSADREARIRQQAKSLNTARSTDVGGFERTRAGLLGLPSASSRTVRLEDPRNEDSGDTRRVELRVERPSSRFARFEQSTGLFTIEYPDNWRTYASNQGYAVSLAPDGGVVDKGNGQQAMLYGVIVNHYAPFEGETDRQRASRERHYAPFEDSGRRGSLEDATDDLVRQIIRSNSYLSAENGSARQEPIDGGSAFSIVLSGRSPVTGEEERVTVFTRSLSDDHVIYALCVVPARDYEYLAQAFSQMVRSLRVNDEAAHRVR